MTNVSFKRQQIFRELPGLDIQSHSEVVVHAAGPDIGLFIELRVIGTRPWRRHLPLRDLFRHRVEHPDTIAPILSPPQAIYGVDVAASSTRSGRRYLVESVVTKVLASVFQTCSLSILMPYMLFCESAITS